MEWENKFTSIIKETESNLSRVRDRLEPSSKTKAFLRSSVDCYGGVIGSSPRRSYSPGNIHLGVTRSSTKSGVAWGPSPRSPVKTIGITTTSPSSQASPALINALFERVEQQAELMGKLSETVLELETERKAQAEEIKKIKDETIRLSEKLKERGNQFKQDVRSELKCVHSQSKLRQSGGETSLGDSAVVNEIRKIIQDESGSLQRELEHFKTRLGEVEIQLHTTLYDSRDILRKHDRLDRALSSLSENQHSQSRSLNSVVKERQADSYEIHQLKHLINKVNEKYSELESELYSSIRHSVVTGQNPSARQPQSDSKFQVTNGRTKLRTKGSKQKTKRRTEDFILSSSDLSEDQHSLAELDLSSASESELVSLAIDGISHSGMTGGEIGNLSNTSLSSLDSDELLGDLNH